MKSSFQNIYEKSILQHPFIVLMIVIMTVIFFSFYIPKFQLDASSDSLLLENDPTLKYYHQIKKRYGSDNYLLVTYTPTDDLFNKPVLEDLNKLRNSLAALKRVKSVTSILNVPLIKSPPVSFAELEEHIPTLLDSATDKGLAKQELLDSPLYSNMLLSKDGKTTALLINFHKNEKRIKLQKEYDHLNNKLLEKDLTKKEKLLYSNVSQEIENLDLFLQKQQKEDITNIRKIISLHKDKATLFLGGIPMIITDSIDFIRDDLETFGLIILCFIVVLLTLIFRTPRWIILPMLVCFCVGVTMIGFLGFMRWPVTIVSSNFLALLLIFTLSFSIHQIVRYREYQANHPYDSQYTLVKNSTFRIIIPCFYMVVTTIIAFGSLVVSDIRPVIDFGWMMAMGLVISFIIAFTLFPSVLLLLNSTKPRNIYDFTGKITRFFAQSIERYHFPILITFVSVILFSVWGWQYLTVENRFIDYFEESTEIYQGMKVIDQKLGGTTPLEIIIDAPKSVLHQQKNNMSYINTVAKEPEVTRGYWFDSWKLGDIAAIHNYLNSLPETGKVLSFHTAMEILADINEEFVKDNFFMAVLYKKLPKEVKETLFLPYLSSDGNQLRFSLRVFESDPSLNRQQLINKIHSNLIEKFGLEENQVRITGMLHLYNNVLQSLFASQIQTVWVVFITIFVIFSILFRSIFVAAVAFLPNVTITALVIGIMGWLHIPLDIMTITIAAICTGTADDNTIHYVHRMIAEFKKHGNYWKAVKLSHNTIGRAMYYTSITIMIGFSILSFSNFVPTVYFGLLTALAMLIALLANLVLLPLLMVTFKPLGKEKYKNR